MAEIPLTSANAGAKPHLVKLVSTRAQTDFDVGQTLAIGDLSERHGKKLVPTREVTGPIVAIVAFNTAAKLFGMNPIQDFTENRLFGAHGASLASRLLRKMTKPSPNRSHQFSYANPSKSATSNRDSLSQPDENERICSISRL
jgi:hypothetical protein